MAATFIPLGSMARERTPSENEHSLMMDLVKLAENRFQRQHQDKHVKPVTSVEYSAIARLFTKKGLRMTPEEVRSVFRMVEQKITTEEKQKEQSEKKVPCIVIDCEEEIRQKAKAVLNVYDKNRDGKVSKKEMESVSGSRLSREVIDRAFAAHDADGDGHLDLKELEHMMRAATEEENRKKRRGSKSKEKA